MAKLLYSDTYKITIIVKVVYMVLIVYLSKDNGLAIERPQKNKNANNTGSDLFLLYNSTSAIAHIKIYILLFHKLFFIT